ncbi:Polyphosphoinositide phosphatase [Trachymyrmex cornetzi]|uniref:Polyphosphoinositide phosphatase n=1 Tax=Trachymyrmex cornetzi TaxID=471704 RepID=A0A151IVC7_9HYME|nr:Polyphosphoinositide phosphatase [Trachymyrmex cornetzi]
MEDQGKSTMVFHPIISSIQKIALYETNSRFYLMGSNNTLTRFRVLKIDRMEPRELVVLDDKREYNQDEIKDLVNMIDMGNRTRAGQRSNVGGVARVVSAFGIVGKNSKEPAPSSSISEEPEQQELQKPLHKPTQTKFTWTSMWQRDTFPRLIPAFALLGFIRFLEGYYIILVTKRRRIAVIGHHTIYKIEDTSMIYIPNDIVRIFHPDEQRYVKMFQSIDLSSNFYFSYSYDISRTFQSNMAPPTRIKSDVLTDMSTSQRESEEPDNSEDFFNMWAFRKDWQTEHKGENYMDYGIRSNPHRRFVWNSHLLKPVEKDLHPEWILYIIHGFIGQSNGDVANEVETEQIVHDSGVSSLSKGRFSSFVQMRGSVPAHWSQDVSKMVPKPTITCDLSDPYVETAGAHFNQLLKRYGSPIIILNLVKKREKKKHESTLSEELSMAVKYLNQFLPPEHHIQYISFDMARMSKRKKVNVMGRLGNIAHNAVLKTEINKINELNQIQNKVKECFAKRGTVQTGIIRTNCVDCLDRTNTAQFAIGKCALGFQLCALGVLESPKLEFDSDCVRMLEELYEDHGDTLALQYGGSQLVHRIKTYRKTAPWTSQGNDIMQTLSRYYSNTFSDQEKQHTINLFLGLFIPEEGKPPIWEILTDYYLHHLPACHYSRKRRLLTQWWDKNVLKCLPYALDEVTKSCSEMIQVQNSIEDMIDVYYDYHRPYELSLLSEVYAYKISHSVRDFMPHFTTCYSPFAVRVRPGRRREEAGSKNLNMKNPSMTGQSSTSSTTSSASSSEDSSSDEDESHQQMDDSQLITSKDSSELMSFESLFPSMKEVYGIEPEYPKRNDIILYKRFVLIGRNATYSTDHTKLRLKLIQTSFHESTAAVIMLPSVKDANISIYEQYVKRATVGGTIPNPNDMNLYEAYASQYKLLMKPVCSG